jgi:serine/threonine protein kinase
MIGKTIKGKYRIVDKIGEGSLATIYAARDMDDNRFSVFKFIHPDLYGERRFGYRFRVRPSS